MKPFKKHMTRLMVLLLLAVLPACAAPNKASVSNAAPVYHPLSNDLASMADPQSTAAPLHCQLGLGTAKFDRGFAGYSTVRFDLLETERVSIDLTSNSGSRIALQGIFDRNGQKIIFCPIRTGAPDQQIACNSFYALDDDLKMGIRRTFDIPDAVTGSTITCGYDLSHLPPLS